jgi:hypothetical protein
MITNVAKNRHTLLPSESTRRPERVSRVALQTRNRERRFITDSKRPQRRQVHLSGLAWEKRFLLQAGYRVISYDRRGFGHSNKFWAVYG